MRSRTSRLSFVAGLALAVAVPGAGRAQDRPGSTSGELASRLGTYLLVGGGVADFTEEGVKDRFGIGGTWDVRLGVGNRLYVGGELGYVGAVRSGGREPRSAESRSCRRSSRRRRSCGSVLRN